MTPDLTRAAPLIAEGYGDRRLAHALGVTRHQARVLIGEAQRGAPVVSGTNAVALYDGACRALAQARTLIEVKDVADRAMALKEYGRLAKDKALQIGAAELRIRAEIRLGQMLVVSPKNAGARGIGKSGVPLENPTLEEIGIDKKLSARAQKLASISERAMEARLNQWRAAAEHDDRVSINILKGGPVNGARSVMGSRQEPDDSLDYFPTPPWATRALIELVLPQTEVFWEREPGLGRVWEPACGEGHIAKVLEEYSDCVAATDIHDYGYGTPDYDFLHRAPDPPIAFDWIITNPPFSGSTDRALEFTLRALDLAFIGVAMFVRSQWAVEGQERYERLFNPHPPTLCAFFTERVNLCKGRWDPNGGTATAYCWLVWLKRQKPGDGLQEPRPPFWIPPGCRKSLTRPDDIARFAAWSLEAPSHDPVTGEIPEATQ